MHTHHIHSTHTHNTCALPRTRRGVRLLRMHNVLHVVDVEEVHFFLYWAAMELIPFAQVHIWGALKCYHYCVCVCVWICARVTVRVCIVASISRCIGAATELTLSSHVCVYVCVCVHVCMCVFACV